MLNFSPNLRIFLAIDPTDMRKSFDGLFALVENVINENPLSGHLFLFRNRKRDRVKLLYWDDELAMLLGGIDLRSITRRRRYQRNTT